jgi:hypothetical protein
MKSLLDSLVTNGTITQSQEDSISSTLDKNRPALPKPPENQSSSKTDSSTSSSTSSTSSSSTDPMASILASMVADGTITKAQEEAIQNSFQVQL